MTVAGYQRWSAGLPPEGEPVRHRPKDAAARLTTGEALEIGVAPKFALQPGTRFF